MIKKLNLIVVFLLCTLFMGCVKDEDVLSTTNDSVEANLSQKSSAVMLKFDSFDAFESFISQRVEANSDLNDEAEMMSNEEGYHSLLLIYNLNLAELDDLGIDPNDVAIVNSYDSMLHLLLNKNGEVNIEGHVYRINGEFVYQYEDGFGYQIDEFLNEYNAGNIDIEIGTSIEYGENLIVYRHNNNENIEEEILGRSATADTYFTGGQYRMKSRQFNGYWLFYSSIGASTHVEQRKRYWFFGWHYYWDTVKRDNRLRYELSYTATDVINTSSSITGYDGGLTVCNCNKANRTYTWSVGFPFAPYTYSPNMGSGQTDHWAHEYSVTPNVAEKTLYY
ncbi:MAG: hypothetical protein R2793_02145 [Flavobacteriaceae bacterium]